MKIFITGAAGYIGGMLTDLFLKDQSVEKVIALDFKDIKEATDRFSEKNPRLKWITWNLGDDGWQEKVLKEGPVDVVIHSAYVIRQGYGEGRKWQIKSNITAADNVFEFAFKNIAGSNGYSFFTTANSTKQSSHLFSCADKSEVNFVVGSHKTVST